MRKMTMLFALLVFGWSALVNAAPAKSFTVEPEGTAVEAGAPVSLKCHFACESGYVLAGWNASIIRKNAPKDFFAKSGLKIRPHATAHDYDAVDFSSDGAGKGYIHFVQALPEGTFPVIIPTAGLPEGDYLIVIMGRFMKGKVASYKPCSFYLTITKGAAANVPFKPALQSQPIGALKKIPMSSTFKSFEMTPALAEVKAGEKVTYQVKSTLSKADGKCIFATVQVLRKDAAPGFFDRPDLKFRKHAKAPGYDCYQIATRLTPGADGTVHFELDTTGFPAGTYLLQYQIYAKDAKGNSYYPTQNFALSVY